MSPQKRHDNLFKRIIADCDDAKLLIRESLPDKILEKLELPKLRLLKESFIDERLRPHFYDLVYNCPLRDKKKRDIKITVLIEHKSYKHKYIHLQLLRYMLNIWEDELQQDRELSLIIPLVVYHGRTKWQPVPFRELFPGYDDLFADYLPDFSFAMEDMKKKDLENILELVEERTYAGILYLLFKYQGTKMFKEKLQEIFRAMLPLLREEFDRLPLSGFLHYILYETDSSWEEVVRLFRQQIPQGDDAMLSTAEQLIQKGREQGIEQGLERITRIARRMLDKGFAVELISEITGLSREEIEKLR